MRNFLGVFHVAMTTFQLDLDGKISKIEVSPIWISDLISRRLVDSPESSWMTDNTSTRVVGHPERSRAVHKPPVYAI